MRSLSIVALLAIFVLDTASAAATTKSFVTCVTSYGPKSISPIKTNSKVLTVSRTATRATVVTPKRTVTPKSTKTSSITATATSSTTLTLPQSTSTFTTILTNSFTETNSATTTILTTTTFLTTTTVTAGTTTIQGSAGFVPIETSIPNSQKKRRAIAGKPIDARAELDVVARAVPKYKLTFNKGKKATCSPAVFPTAVGCTGLVAVETTKTITKTASKTQTVTAPQPTAFTTTTATVVTTITITPEVASTTLTSTVATTETVTTTMSTTSTISETATVSVTAPQATSYAVCADNNIVTIIDGQYIYGAYASASYVSYTTSSAYDCCVQCAQTANCAGTVGRESTGQCLLAIVDTCASSNAGFGLALDSANNGDIYASNGNCGSDYVVSA